MEAVKIKGIRTVNRKSESKYLAPIKYCYYGVSTYYDALLALRGYLKDVVRTKDERRMTALPVH